MSVRADFEQVDSDSGGRCSASPACCRLASLGDLPDRLDRIDGQVARLDLSPGSSGSALVGAWVIHRFRAR